MFFYLALTIMVIYTLFFFYVDTRDYLNKGGSLKFNIKELNEDLGKEYKFEIIDESSVAFSNVYKELTGSRFVN